MEFKKCSRCGNFYVSNGMVCPKCTPKDQFEYSSFKSYVEHNGLNNSLDNIAQETGLSKKNISRYIEYNEAQNANNALENNTKNNTVNLANSGNDLNKKNNNGITFLI